MNATITLNYQKLSIFDKMIVFRIIQEVYAKKPFGFEINQTSSDLNKEMKFEMVWNNIFNEDFIFFLFRKRRELKALISGRIVFRLQKSLRRGKISIEKIDSVITHYFDLPDGSLQLNTRKRIINEPRQIAMFFAKVMTENSLSIIGQRFAERDHATVLHACKTVNGFIDTDKKFKAKILDIEKKLKQA